MKIKDIFKGAVVIGVSAIFLTRMSDNEIGTSILPYDFIENHIYRDVDMGRDIHAAELDSAQAAYPLFNRWEALTLHNSNIDSAYTSQLRKKYGDEIGANSIISAKELALSRKELENFIRPVYNEDYFKILPPQKEFDFRKEFMENALNVLEYTPRDFPYRFPERFRELRLIEIPEEVKLIEINENND